MPRQNSLQFGAITVVLPGSVTLPAKAGTLSADELAKIPKPPRAVGAMCERMADVLEETGKGLTRTPEVTPNALRDAGAAADDIDRVIAQAEAVVAKLKQANLLLDAHAYELLRKLNDQVKAQGKHDAQWLTVFAELTSYFAKTRNAPRPTEDPPQ